MKKTEKILTIITIIASTIAIGIWVTSFDVLGCMVVIGIALGFIVYALTQNSNTVTIEIVFDEED